MYIFYGSASLPQQSILNLSQTNADVTFYGPVDNSQLGKSIAAGNINNDAYDDIIIGAPYHSQNDIQMRGAVYVIYGTPGLRGNIDLASGGFDIKILG